MINKNEEIKKEEKVINNFKTIEDYLKNCFKAFSLNYLVFFGNFNSDIYSKRKTRIPVKSGNDKINTSAIELASEVLGIRENDILETNDDIIKRRLEEYDFFRQNAQFFLAKKYSEKNYSPEARLLKAVFNENFGERYDRESVEKRLKQVLIDTEKTIPRTYHYGAEITELNISTRYFCHYENIYELINSYFYMIEKWTKLLLAALTDGLEQDDIYEYNFLVSVLDICDKYFTSVELYYDNLIICKDMYKNINEENIYDYIRIKSVGQLEPWCCAEFINDEELMKKFLRLFPECKSEMQSFSSSVSCFSCRFLWSDAPFVIYDGFLPDEKVKEISSARVCKTKKEFFGDYETAKKLKRYSRPENLGGLPTEKRNYPYGEKYISCDPLRIEPYIKSIKKYNYFDRKGRNSKKNDE